MALFRAPLDFNAITAMPAAEHPPWITWLTMAGWKIFGLGLVWPHVFSSLTGVLAIVGTYCLGREFLDKHQARAAAFCLAFNWVFFAQASNPYVEIAMTAGLMWTLRSLLRGQWVAMALWVSFMTLSKETSLPMILPMAIYLYLRGRQTRGIAALLLGTLPALAWIVFAAFASGGFLKNSLSAASTNGGVPHDVITLVRKLALGPVQMLMLGLWVPSAVLGLWSLKSGVNRTRIPAVAWLLLAVVMISLLEHSLVSIGLNRYYIPLIGLSWLLIWRVHPANRYLSIVTVSLSLMWSLNCYFRGARYAITEDWYAGVRYAQAHGEIDRTLERLNDGGIVLSSYPTTSELSIPFYGYIQRAQPVVEIIRASAQDIKAARWAIVSDGPMYYPQVAAALKNRKLSIAASASYGAGKVVLYRVD